MDYQDYYQEKISGVPMIKDIIVPIAKKLFEKNMLDENEYFNVYTRLHSMPIPH